MQQETAHRLLNYLIQVAENRKTREGANTKRAAAFDSRISTILDDDPEVSTEERVNLIKLARLVYFSQASEEELNLPITRANPDEYKRID